MTDKTDPIVSVPVGDLLRVTPFKGDQDIRYYLNGVCVVPYEDHALLVATNGHWIAVYESKDSRTDIERILDLPEWFVDQVKEAERGSGDDDEDDEDARSPLPKLLTVDHQKARLVISESGCEVLVKPGLPFIDGAFPDWRRVIPDPTTLERGIFSPISVHYLAALGESVPELTHSHGITCYQQRGADDKPVVFRFAHFPQFIAALMPLRTDESHEWPKWTAKPPKVEAPAATESVA